MSAHSYTLSIMLFLSGGNVISVGTSMHKRFVTTHNVSTVQVTVRATTLTDVGIRLRLPMSLKVVLNSPVFTVCFIYNESH